MNLNLNFWEVHGSTGCKTVWLKLHVWFFGSFARWNFNAGCLVNCWMLELKSTFFSLFNRPGCISINLYIYVSILSYLILSYLILSYPQELPPPRQTKKAPQRPSATNGIPLPPCARPPLSIEVVRFVPPCLRFYDLKRLWPEAIGRRMWATPKTPMTWTMKYWLSNRDPYFMAYFNPYCNWVVQSLLYSK